MASPTISGLSGFDSSGLVSQLVSYAAEPLNNISKQQSLVDSATSTVNSFSTLLTNLKKAATDLSTSSGFSSMAATSSDTGIVASVSGSAIGASYSVNVTQLARAQKTRSDQQTSSDTALGQAGNLTLQIGSGNPTTIAIAATDTLTDIATKINQQGLRVSASIVNAGGSYSLSLQGLDTGAQSAFTVSEGAGVSLGLASAANTYQTAQDAKLTIDGQQITRPTNSIAGAIQGVTLALKSTTTTPATLGVASDSTALKTKINAFVSSFNAVVNSAHTATGYGTVKATNALLAGDSSIRSALSTIDGAISGVVSGATGSYTSLSSVGLKHNTDGTLALDGDKLDAALQKDPDAVRRLFITDTNINATGVMSKLVGKIDGLVTSDGGTIKNKLKTLSTQKTRLQKTYDDTTDRITKYQTNLKAQFARLDQAMSKYSSMSSSVSAINSITTSIYG